MSESLRLVLAGFGGGAFVGQAETVARFFELRSRWAGAHNLSGPRALKDPGATDLTDAAALAELVDPAVPLYDIGAGSGVPGALVALLREDVRVVAIEPLAKRTAFLRQVISTLALRNLEVRRATWPIALEGPGAVVSRAVFPVPTWPGAAAAGGTSVTTVYRYLARERPPFDVGGFERVSTRLYAGPADSEHLLERWDRVG